MSTSDEQVAARHYALLCFLTLLNVMNFVDRQLLASFANFIVPDLGLTNAEFGLLTGFAFLIFYSTMGLFMGTLADLMHRPRLIAGALTLWSVLTAASGAARGFVSLAIPRAFIGIGESALTPASMSLLSDRFPAKRLGFAAGFYYMGVPIGVGVSLLIAGYLGPAIGWRNCFYSLGVVGVIMAIVLLFVRDERASERLAGGISAPPKQSFGAVLITLAKALRFSPALCYTIAGGVAYHFVLGAATFDQLWYVQELGFERARIAQLSGWIGMIGGVLGNLFGGIAGDWWARRPGATRATFLAIISILLTPIGIAYRLSGGDNLWFWIGIFVGFFQLGTFYGPTFSTVQELSPPNIRATVVAFYILMLNLVGLAFGITGGGFLVDALIARGHETPYTLTLLLFTLVSAISIPLFLLAGRRYHRDRDRLYEALAVSGS